MEKNQTSKMELFVKIVNEMGTLVVKRFKTECFIEKAKNLLTIFEKKLHHT